MAAKAKTRKTRACSSIPLDKGTVIRVLRPNMWSGYCGVVSRYDKESTVHTVRLKSPNGGEFDAAAYADELERI